MLSYAEHGKNRAPTQGPPVPERDEIGAPSLFSGSGLDQAQRSKWTTGRAAAQWARSPEKARARASHRDRLNFTELRKAIFDNMRDGSRPSPRESRMHDTRLLADQNETSVGDGKSGMADSASILSKIEMSYRAVKPSRRLAKKAGRLLRLVSTGQGRAAVPILSGSAALMPPLDFMARGAGFMAVS
jgi:hypothetical protein